MYTKGCQATMRIRSNLNGLDEALEENGTELHFVQLQLNE